MNGLCMALVVLMQVPGAPQMPPSLQQTAQTLRGHSGSYTGRRLIYFLGSAAMVAAPANMARAALLLSLPPRIGGGTPMPVVGS